MRKIFIIFLIIQFGLYSLKGQTYFYKHFGWEEGLPSNEIQSIFKDSKGYLWIGTNAGLVRYDGKEFTLFNSSNGLAGDKVWAISEDNSHRLWFGCYGAGISVYDGEKFRTYNKKTGLVNDRVRVLYFSVRSNLMFIGTDDGLSIFNGKSFENYSQQKGNLTHQAQFMSFLDSGDSIQCFTYVGGDFYNYFPKKNVLSVISHNQIYYCLNSRSCASIRCKDSSIILGVERSGIKVIKKNKVKSFENIGQVFGICHGKGNNIWITGWVYKGMKEPGGLFCYTGDSIRNISKELGISARFGWPVLYDSV